MKTLLSISLTVVCLVLTGCNTQTAGVIDGLRQIRTGMSADEVVRRAGQPDSKDALDAGHEVWTWKFISPIEGAANATFVLKDGVVAETAAAAGRSRSEWLREATRNSDRMTRRAMEASQTIKYAKIRQQASEEADAKRLLYVKSQTQRPPHILKSVGERSVCVGMNELEVELAWGTPIQRNKSGGIGGTFDQWVYPNFNYIYFRDGVVTSWQTTQ